MPASKQTDEEPKGTLSPGDPEASYVSPDLSNQFAAGTLPDEEQEWHDNRDDARADELEAATSNEDEVVKRRAAEAQGKRDAAEKTEKTEKTTAPKSSGTSSAST